jgi:hypothetical protein
MSIKISNAHELRSIAVHAVNRWGTASVQIKAGDAAWVAPETATFRRHGHKAPVSLFRLYQLLCRVYGQSCTTR